eukprot:TRINITY_DN22565_c0_g1_i1.p1 TRINITY_DN22565_c0_g1~~TRINITY_DN22565_c0_g1_i1.p1  ORF type:complete len:259 (-),score=47.97 TRINITY_DN22565_c0_g1_i1:255-1031(-)
MAASPRPEEGSSANPEEVLSRVQRNRWDRQARSMQSFGKQILSPRHTSPSISFGFRATQERLGPRVTWEQSDLWMKYDAEDEVPGPGYYKLPDVADTTKACVQKNFGTEMRFPAPEQNDLSTKLEEAHAKWASACGDKDAMLRVPMSHQDVLNSIEGAGGELAAEGDDAAGHNDSSRQAISSVAKRPAGASAAGSIKAVGTFGSSTLGARFQPGTSFSRKAPCRTNARKSNYRELREQLPLRELVRSELSKHEKNIAP